MKLNFIAQINQNQILRRESCATRKSPRPNVLVDSQDGDCVQLSN